MLTQVLKLIDNHDLYGSVAYPKRHTQKDISDIYRLCLATHGVFTNVALQEPFGLTVIEVSARVNVTQSQTTGSRKVTQGLSIFLAASCCFMISS